MSLRLLVACLYAVVAFGQTVAPTQEEIILATSMRGHRFANTILGITYELPKSVEDNWAFAATQGRDTVLAGLGKQQTGPNRKVVVVTASHSQLTPKQVISAKVQNLTEVARFRWIKQASQTQIGEVSGWFAAWETEKCSAIFVTRNGEFTLVWSFEAPDETSLKKLTDSLSTLRLEPRQN